MNRAFIFIGSNIERERNYLEALRQIAGLGRLTRISQVYQTPPVGGEGDDYLNGSVLLETRLSASELHARLREIEARMGRNRSENRYAPRTIDLDLVLYNRDWMDEGDLRIPDPLIFNRAFLAQTLAEIDPDYVHPVSGERLADIARRLAPGSPEIRLDRDMSARARRAFENLTTGEVTHA